MEAAPAHILAPEAGKPQDLPEVGCDILGALYQQLGHSALQVGKFSKRDICGVRTEISSIHGREGETGDEGYIWRRQVVYIAIPNPQNMGGKMTTKHI